MRMTFSGCELNGIRGSFDNLIKVTIKCFTDQVKMLKVDSFRKLVVIIV